MSQNKRKPQLHPSQMNMLFKCGEQFRRRYIENEIIPPNMALIVGSGTHRSQEKDLISKVETGQLLDVEEIDSIATDYIKGEFQNGITLTDEEKEIGIKKVKGQAIDTAVKMARLHHKELAPIIEPKSVDHIERRLLVKMPNHPFDLAGTLDIQEKDDTVRDTKTSKRSPAKGDADKSFQLTFYALALLIIDGKLPPKMTLDFLVKIKTPKVVVQPTVRTMDHIKVGLRRIETAMKIIENEMWTPADPTSWICSRDWCGYFQTCPYALGKKVFGYENQKTKD